MNLANQLLAQINDPTINCNERARLCCQLAKVCEESGNYEGALDAMSEFWPHIDKRPVLDNLDQATAAEVLLRAGVLTGWIGSIKQIENAQETAKNLISESINIYQALQDTERMGEAQSELAHCYWREGAFNEARVMFQTALNHLAGTNSELKAITLLRSAVLEKTATRHHDALRIYTEAAPLFKVSDNQALKGKYHNGFANLLENLGRTEGREDYIDRALVEYAAASFHFEQAGHVRYQGCVENNLGFLFYKLGKFDEAHEHLDRAQALFTSLKDISRLAGVDETRARVSLAEGKVAEAERLARSAVQVLEKGGEQSLFAEALTTHGTALARLGRHQQAQLTLQNAIEVAHQAGDREGAGQAALAMIEELGEQLNDDDLSATYERAADLLEQSQHPGLLARLNACARRVLCLLVACPAPANWENFSLREQVRRYERRVIERALREAQGSVTRAAHLLSLKHQTLNALLQNRHRELLHARKPINPRRRSIIRQDLRSSRRKTMNINPSRLILHVEDNKLVADAVRDTLKLEGWEVESCADGQEALSRLESETPYALLLFDNDLPGLSGLELVRHARRLPHRRDTLIVMLSAINCEAEAFSAGVNLFLRKPEDVLRLAEAISLLLAGKSEQH